MSVTFDVKSNDRGLKRFFERIEGLKDMDVKVGILTDDQHAGSDLSNAELAAVLSFGTEDGHIPPRPFIEPTIRKNRPKYITLLKKLLTLALKGKLSLKQAFDVVGEQAVADIKAYITAGVPPPNAPSTVAKKGSSTPLIDTGSLLNSISYAVEE